MGMFDGLTKGLQYDRDFLLAFSGAVKHQDWSSMLALAGIAETHAVEIAHCIPNVLNLFGDPFAGSRHQFQQWEAAHTAAQQAEAAAQLEQMAAQQQSAPAAPAAPAPESSLRSDTLPPTPTRSMPTVTRQVVQAAPAPPAPIVSGIVSGPVSPSLHVEEGGKQDAPGTGSPGLPEGNI